MKNRDIIFQVMERERKKFIELVKFDEFIEAKVGMPLIGVDEAGRGPLAGPVVAVAIQVEKDVDLVGIDDSKELNSKRREEMFEKIVEHSIYGVGISTTDEIDENNILEATKMAMRRALKVLYMKNVRGFVVVDGKNLDLGFNEMNIIKGDKKSFAIACASILAKVIRDRIMVGYSKVYPDYLFERHKGYPTRKHLEKLRIHGPTPFHRLSFKPVLELVDENILNSWYESGYLSHRRFEKIKMKLREV